MEGFDFTASPKLPAAQIRDLAALRWLHARESLILYGPVGVGKATSCGCRKPCQLCDLGIFTDQAAEPVAPQHPRYSCLLRADASVQRAVCAAASGAADESCNGLRTRRGPAAGAARRRSASGLGIRGGHWRSSVRL